MLSLSATCQKIVPWGKHTQGDAHRGLTSTFLFWEQKRVTSCFSVSEKVFLGWKERWEATQNLDPKSRDIYHWNSWMRHKTPDIPSNLKDSCLCLRCYTFMYYSLRVLSQATFPWHISISSMFHKPASSSSSAQWLYFHSWVGSLINQPLSPAQTLQPH